MADGDFRDEVKCACPRIHGDDCARTRNPGPVDDFERGGWDGNEDDCMCRCHDLRAEWERDLEDDRAEQWEAEANG